MAIKFAEAAPHRVGTPYGAHETGDDGVGHYGQQLPREEIAKRNGGRKPDPNAKQLLTLRLDPDVIAAFRATGEGWQTRMNEALRKAAGL